MISLMIILVSMATTSFAHDLEFNPLASESSLFQEMAQRGAIHLDPREPPPHRDIQLQKRDGGDNVVPTTVSGSAPSPASASVSGSPLPPEETTVAITTATATDTGLSPSAVFTSISPSITVVTTPLPMPFDTSVGSNFTDSSCPQFFSTFLGNSTFKSCVPVSLLLQNSNSFFRAERSPTLLAQTLDAACNAPLAICSPLMTNIASQLLEASNCGQDFKQQNPLVSQAYAGLIAYEPIYRATCLRDTATGSYCFADAITNATDQADFYPYYTPLGLVMPATAQPTCTQCLKDTMQIFAGYAQDTVQPLSGTYMSCAAQIDNGCGPGFAATDIKVGSVSSANAAPASSASWSWVLTGVGAALSALLVGL